MISKKDQILRVVPPACITVLFIGVSAIFVPISTLGFELPKFAMLSLLTFCCVLALLLQKSDPIGVLLRTTQGKLYLLLMAIVVLSPLWSVAPIVSLLGSAPRFQGALTYTLCLLMGMCAAAAVQRNDWKRLFVLACIGTNMFVVGYGLLQMLNMDPMQAVWLSESFLGRIFSTLGHPNSLGQCILLTVPFVIRAWLSAPTREGKLALGGVIVINATVLLGTVSRSALLGALVLLLFYVPSLRVWIKQRISTVRPEQGFVLSLIIVLAATVGLLFFAQRFQGTFAEGRSVGSREVIATSTWNMILERPLGWGLDAMAFTSPRFVGKELYNYESLTTVVDRAHNNLLQTLLTLGVGGCIVYVVLLWMVLYGVWKNRGRDKTGFLRALGAGIFGYLVAVFFGFASIATGMLFWVLVGACIGSLPAASVSSKLRASRVVLVAGVLVSTIAIVVSVQWMQARLVHAYAAVAFRQDRLLGVGLHQEAVLLFRYDREMLMSAAEAHLLALEDAALPERETVEQSVLVLIQLLRNLTGGFDGVPDLLDAWLGAIRSDRGTVDAALSRAQTFMPESITYHRTALHIAELLDDGVKAEEHRMGIRGLLPDAYFDAKSELRRILLKQHPWLLGL